MRNFKSLFSHKKYLLYLCGALSLLIVCAIAYFSSAKGGDFSLNFRGQKWTYSQDARKINLLYIGYAKCPDVCPLSLSISAQAFKKLNSEDAKNVRLLFVSVDYPHDTPSAVADFASQFNADFVGLTGAGQEIKATVQKFDAKFFIEEAPNTHLGYTIAHTDKIFFLNKYGKVIDSLANPRSEEDILNKLRKHL